MPTVDDAPWPTIEVLEAQERNLVFARADLESLHELGRRMSQAAIERELPIVIQIRSGARLVYGSALPGSTADGRPSGEIASPVAAGT